MKLSCTKISFSLFVVFIFAFFTTTSKFVTFYTGIPLILYLSSIPLFLISFLLILKKGKLSVFYEDKLIIIIFIMPLIYFILSFLFSEYFSIKHAFIALITETLLFYPYFLGRMVPTKFILSFITIIFFLTFISAIVIILQQLNIMDSLYLIQPVTYEGDGKYYAVQLLGGSIAPYMNSLGELSFRKDGIFGNWHTAAYFLLAMIVYNNSARKSKSIFVKELSLQSRYSKDVKCSIPDKSNRVSILVDCTVKLVRFSAKSLRIYPDWAKVL